MDATGGLILLTVVLVVAVLGWASYVQYRRKARIAQAKSRAALNRLLAEADALEQSRRADPDAVVDPDLPDIPEDPGDSRHPGR